MVMSRGGGGLGGKGNPRRDVTSWQVTWGHATPISNTDQTLLTYNAAYQPSNTQHCPPHPFTSFLRLSTKACPPYISKPSLWQCVYCTEDCDCLLLYVLSYDWSGYLASSLGRGLYVIWMQLCQARGNVASVLVNRGEINHLILYFGLFDTFKPSKYGLMLYQTSTCVWPTSNCI